MLHKACISLSVLSLLAGSAFGQWAVVPEAGLNFSQYQFHINSLSSKMRANYRLGASAQIPIYKFLYLQTGATLMRNGYNIRTTSVEVNTLTTVNTLQIPLTITAKMGKPGKDRLLLSAGGFYATNLNGKFKEYNGPYTRTGSLAFGDGYGKNLKTTEFGVMLSAGCEFNNHITAQLYAQQGLTTLNPSSGPDLVRIQFGLSVGYAIGASTFRKKQTPEQ